MEYFFVHTEPKFETYIPGMKLRGTVPNFYIHVSMRDLYIPT